MFRKTSRTRGRTGSNRTVFGHPSFVPLTSAAVMLVLVAILSAAVKAKPSGLERLNDVLNELSGDSDKTSSPFFFVLGNNDEDTDSFPLKSTKADVQIVGSVASVTITQVYGNQGRNTIEAMYVFPASTRAAVHSMKMTIGNRVIQAKIEKRTDAEKEYAKALEQGKTASLLEQHRPNVFQMRVGNIMPGDEVKVELSYFEVLVPDRASYEFVFPSVVGPRFAGESNDLGIRSEWNHNPYLHQGSSPAYDFDLNVHIRSAMPVSAISSPSHDITVDFQDATSADVSLKNGKNAGNRDFVLEYVLSGDSISAGALLYRGEKENFFMLMLEPPKAIEEDQVLPREYLFVQDVSGSMNGFPMQVSKRLMAKLFENLGEQDYFNVLAFAGGGDTLWREPMPATKDNKEAALNWLGAYRGGGGTRLLDALEKAFRMPRQEGVSRTIVVITDGYVDVEKEAFDLIRKNLADTNLFAFGVGSSVNRFLVEGMARAGMGLPFVVLNSAEAEAEADRFAQYVSSPVLKNVSVDIECLDAYDLEPPVLPDLFAQRPLVLMGKYRGEACGNIVVSGETSSQTVFRKLPLSSHMESRRNSAIRLLWARSRVQRISDMNKLSHDHERTKEITNLGLKYGLLTDYTSFVAVDTEMRADGTKRVTVRQPLPMPLGVSDLAVASGAGRAAAYFGGIGPMPRHRTKHIPRAPGIKLGLLGSEAEAKYIPRAPGIKAESIAGRALRDRDDAGRRPPRAWIRSMVIKGKLSTLDRRKIKKVIQEAANLAARELRAELRSCKCTLSVVVRLDMDARGSVKTVKVNGLPPGFGKNVERKLVQIMSKLTFRAKDSIERIRCRISMQAR